MMDFGTLMARSAQLILKEMQTFKRMARIVHDIYAGQLKSPRLISYMTNLSPASLKAPKGAPRQRAVWASFAKSPTRNGPENFGPAAGGFTQAPGGRAPPKLERVESPAFALRPAANPPRR